VHAVRAAGRLLVDQVQPPACDIDPIRRGLGAVAVRGVEAAALTIDREKGRIGEVLYDLDERPGIALAVAVMDTDPVAVPASVGRIAADVHEGRRRVRHSRLRDRPQRARRDCRRGASEPNQKFAALHCVHFLTQSEI
jgi:hypothetical protein